MRISKEGYIDYELNNQRPTMIPQQEQPYQQYQPQYPEHEEYYGEEQPRQMHPQMMQTIYPGQDTGFLKWLFDFRKEAITPLRHIWRGEEYNFKTDEWEPSKFKGQIMNEEGITWGISLIESYMNPAFIVTDLDEKTYNFRMREAAKVIWNSLSLRYINFALMKSDIPRVAEEIESKISAILRGALDNGYRDFFSTQNQNIETKNLTPTQEQPRASLISRTANLFRRAQG